MTGPRSWLVILLVSLATLTWVGVATTGTAHAAVTVSRAEVSGDRLRIEGSAIAGRPITVDGVQMTTSSSSICTWCTEARMPVVRSDSTSTWIDCGRPAVSSGSRAIAAASLHSAGGTLDGECEPSDVPPGP